MDAVFWELNFSVFCCVQGFVVCRLLVNLLPGGLVCPLLSWFRQLMVRGPVFQGLPLCPVM